MERTSIQTCLSWPVARANARKKTHRGPAHAWKRWNGLLKPQRIAILQAFKEGYVDYRIAAFASESQADAALLETASDFSGHMGLA